MVIISKKINIPDIKIQQLGRQPYELIVQKMQQFTADRQDSSADELWITEHDPVYTLGFNGKAEHIINSTNIPIVRTDRGGQVTYHGPGQIVIYLLIDIRRRQLAIRSLVRLIEQAIINLLSNYQITAQGDEKAPGVYVEGKKIAALGLRVKQKGTYHGLALNLDMDLSPYQNINPCGVENAEITQLRNLGVTDNKTIISNKLVEIMKTLLDAEK